MSLVSSINSVNLSSPTVPEERCGLAKKLWHTYVWNPDLPSGGWFTQTPVPKNFDDWTYKEARNAYAVLTTPKLPISGTERVLFDYLEAEPRLAERPKIKTIHGLIERGSLNFTDASALLRKGLVPIVASLKEGESALQNGEETLVCIPVSTPKADASAPHYEWRAGLVVLAPITVLVLLFSFILGLYRRDSTLKNNAEWLWTPGVAHISLIAVTTKNEDGQLKAGPYEYFDSKGLPLEDLENRLAANPEEKERHLVRELIPVINSALANSGVVTNEIPDVFHSDQQFQADVYNCGYWVFMYAKHRAEGRSAEETLGQLATQSKTINTWRRRFSLNQHFVKFLSEYCPPTAKGSGLDWQPWEEEVYLDWQDGEDREEEVYLDRQTLEDKVYLDWQDKEDMDAGFDQLFC